MHICTCTEPPVIAILNASPYKEERKVTMKMVVYIEARGPKAQQVGL